MDSITSRSGIYRDQLISIAESYQWTYSKGSSAYRILQEVIRQHVCGRVIKDANWKGLFVWTCLINMMFGCSMAELMSKKM